MPRIKNSLGGKNTHLHTINNSSEQLDIGNLGNIIDAPGSQTGRKLFNFRRDGSDNPIKLQRKIKELNELLNDKDTQIDFLKKTIKFTEANELKQENDILYAECRRMRKLVNELMK